MHRSKLSLFLFLSVLIHFFTSTCLFAQSRSYTVQGKLQDRQQQAVEHALLSLLRLPDSSVLSKSSSPRDGSFSLSAPFQGKFFIRISSLEFKTVQSAPFYLDKDTILARPFIMDSDAKQLAEVNIKAQEPALLQASGNKLIYNVGESINAKGTNTLEVLKKTPGVIVERDNSIGLNGRKGVLVLINGKNSYLQGEELTSYLRSLPSSNVKSIEIMSNGSAQYDAAGTAGIINIKLAKPAGNGFNLNLSSGLSYGLTLKQNTELSFNSRQDKLNVFGNYSHAFGNNAYRYGMTRTQDDKVFQSPTLDTDYRKTMGGTIGADYELDSRQTIGAVFNLNAVFGPGITDTRTTIRDAASGLLLNTLIAQNDYYQQNASRYNANVNYRFQDSLGRAFSFDADYGYFDGGSKNLQPNTYYKADGSLESSSTYRSLNKRNIYLYALASTYQFNVAKGKVNVGLKLSGVSADNGFINRLVKGTEESIDYGRSNQFDYKERIAAAFAQYQVPLSAKLKLEAGLRLEHTYSLGQLVPLAPGGQAPEDIKRDYTNIFPAFSLNYQIHPEQALSLSYGKRIDRPSYQNLNPFEYLLDELSFWKGNPFLQPQINHKAELMYSFHQTVISFAYSLTNNYAAQITDTLQVNKVVMMPKNLGKQYHASLSIAQQFKIKEGWNLSLSATGYHVRNKIAFGLYRDFDLSRYAATLNVQQTFRMPLKIKGELSALYNSPRLGGSNEIMKNSSQIDLGFQRNFFQDRASLKLAFTDIFRGNNWDSKSRMNGLYLDSYGNAESRQVRLNFSYRFGGAKVKERQQRDNGLKNETQRL